MGLIRCVFICSGNLGGECESESKHATLVSSTSSLTTIVAKSVRLMSSVCSILLFW